MVLLITIVKPQQVNALVNHTLLVKNVMNQNLDIITFLTLKVSD